MPYQPTHQPTNQTQFLSSSLEQTMFFYLFIFDMRLTKKQRKN